MGVFQYQGPWKTLEYVSILTWFNVTLQLLKSVFFKSSIYPHVKLWSPILVKYESALHWDLCISYNNHDQCFFIIFLKLSCIPLSNSDRLLKHHLNIIQSLPDHGILTEVQFPVPEYVYASILLIMNLLVMIRFF